MISRRVLSFALISLSTVSAFAGLGCVDDGTADFTRSYSFSATVMTTDGTPIAI